MPHLLGVVRVVQGVLRVVLGVVLGLVLAFVRCVLRAVQFSSELFGLFWRLFGLVWRCSNCRWSCTLGLGVVQDVQGIVRVMLGV